MFVIEPGDFLILFPTLATRGAGFVDFPVPSGITPWSVTATLAATWPSSFITHPLFRVLTWWPWMLPFRLLRVLLQAPSSLSRSTRLYYYILLTFLVLQQRQRYSIIVDRVLDLVFTLQSYSYTYRLHCHWLCLWWWLCLCCGSAVI